MGICSPRWQYEVNERNSPFVGLLAIDMMVESGRSEDVEKWVALCCDNGAGGRKQTDAIEGQRTTNAGKMVNNPGVAGSFRSLTIAKTYPAVGKVRPRYGPRILYQISYRQACLASATELVKIHIRNSSREVRLPVFCLSTFLLQRQERSIEHQTFKL